jgi:hypothetical protein
MIVTTNNLLDNAEAGEQGPRQLETVMTRKPMKPKTAPIPKPVTEVFNSQPIGDDRLSDIDHLDELNGMVSQEERPVFERR